MILITGGNGYIGTAITEMLIKNGKEFRIFDNLSGSSPLNLFYLNDRAEFIWGDVRNINELKTAFKDIDSVIHLAARLPAAPGLVDEINENVKSVNVDGTENVLELARKYDTRVVFASTCNIYGIGMNLSETSEVRPLNPYAESKLEAEKMCMEYYKTYGLDVVIIRLSSVYGYSIGVRFNLVVNYFTIRALMNYPLTVFGRGDNWRPFVHVKDAAKAFLYFLEKGRAGETYNVGSENCKIGDLAKKVKRIVNPKARIVFVEDKEPEFSYHVDFTKAIKAGFKPRFSLEDGVKELATKLVHLKNYRLSD